MYQVLATIRVINLLLMVTCSNGQRQKYLLLMNPALKASTLRAQVTTGHRTYVGCKGNSWLAFVELLSMS